MPHCVVGSKEMGGLRGAWPHCRPVLNGNAPNPCPYDLYDELKSTSGN